MMIGSVNYAGVNVRVWYMFSGSVQHMTALEIIHGRIRKSIGGEVWGV